MKYTIGDVVTFSNIYTSKAKLLGYIDEIMICDGMCAYWITYAHNAGDRAFRFEDEIKLAKDKQIVEQLSDLLKLELVANYAENL